MNRFGRMMTAAVVSAVVAVQAADAGLGIEVGGKLWFVSFSDPVVSQDILLPDGFFGSGFNGRPDGTLSTDTKLDYLVLIGPKFQWSSTKIPLWVSGMVLVGTTEGDIEGTVTDEVGNSADITGDFSFTLTDSELLVGYSFPFVDVGVGFRHTIWKESDKKVTLSDGDDSVTYQYEDQDLTIFGPMVYVGAGNTIGKLPLGWYAGASIMFLDLGDSPDKDGEHYNIEFGAFYSKNHLSATGGLRLKGFPKHSDPEDGGDMTQFGLALSASYKF